MWHTEPNWQDLQAVTIELEDHIDFDALESDPEMPAVLAIARRLIADDHEVVVVTEDDAEKPEMISTVQACDQLGLDVVNLATCCTDFGLAHLLV